MSEPSSYPGAHRPSHHEPGGYPASRGDRGITRRWMMLAAVVVVLFLVFMAVWYFRFGRLT